MTLASWISISLKGLGSVVHHESSACDGHGRSAARAQAYEEGNLKVEVLGVGAYDGRD